MRRLSLIAAIVAVLLFGIYSVVWWIAAGRIEAGATIWAQTARAQGISVSWQALRVAGYPLSFRVELTEARFTDTALTPAPDLAAPLVSASIHPWNFRTAALAAPAGLSGGSAGLGTISAGHALGTVNIAADGGVSAWLALNDVKAAAALIPQAKTTAETTQFWLTLPPAPPRATTTDSAIVFAADLTRLSVPMAPKALGDTVDDLAFGVAVKGPVSPGDPRQAATAWRDAGGTVELDHLHVGWGALGIDAAGTLALDRDLQPTGSFTGALSGYDELLAALVSTGQLRESDARPLKFVLRALATPGPDGKKRIQTSFSLQNGQIFVGPATLGRVPRIPW